MIVQTLDYVDMRAKIVQTIYIKNNLCIYVKSSGFFI